MSQFGDERKTSEQALERLEGAHASVRALVGWGSSRSLTERRLVAEREVRVRLLIARKTHVDERTAPVQLASSRHRGPRSRRVAWLKDRAFEQ